MKTLELYSAKWCGPCKQIKTYINQIKECEISIFDYDEDFERFKELDIKSVPTIIVRSGNVSHRRTGLLSLDDIQKIVNEISVQF